MCCLDKTGMLPLKMKVQQKHVHYSNDACVFEYAIWMKQGCSFAVLTLQVCLHAEDGREAEVFDYIVSCTYHQEN